LRLPSGVIGTGFQMSKIDLDNLPMSKDVVSQLPALASAMKVNIGEGIYVANFLQWNNLLEIGQKKSTSSRTGRYRYDFRATICPIL
jgi:hypothetical protein